MSLRTELEELAKWISTLTAKQESETTPTPLPRENWQRIEHDLRATTRELKAARDLLRTEWERVGGARDDLSKRFASLRHWLGHDVHSRQAEYADDVERAAEVAGDVHREAEALALRALLFSWRATPQTGAEPAESKTPTTPEREAMMLRTLVLSWRAVPEAAESEAATADSHAEEADPDAATLESEPSAASQLVGKAMATIETAHKELHLLRRRDREVEVKHPDAVSKAFDEELDVVAEMTLSLRQQLARLDEDRSELARRDDDPSQVSG